MINRYLKKALPPKMEQLNANGPMTDQQLAPVKAAQALSGASDEDF
ncbi:hypothetical protein [Sulfitobacter sp.]